MQIITIYLLLVHCKIIILLQGFHAGTLVLLRNSKRDSKKGDKMKPKWLGPYAVVSSMGKDL